MPEVKGLGNTSIQPLTPQIENKDAVVPKAGQVGAQNLDVNLPVGQPGAQEQIINLPKPPDGKIFSDAVTGRERTQLDAAEQMRSAGGISATDRLLGLHLQPTIAGALTAPPGNMEALRHLNPTMRRAAMRNLLTKQRERARRLAQLVRRERDQREDGGEDSGQKLLEESFVALLTDGSEGGFSDEQVNRATEELVAMARMLDLLDEMMNLQDYTLSQMGSFAQG